MARTESFNWLHLTDLHYGQGGQRPLWPSTREAFFDDLRQLHARCGPWHAVLFTGDLVQSGRPEQFAALEAEVLDRLWKELAGLGSGDAVLLAVPGNHDLERPPPEKRPSAALRQLLRPGGFAEVEAEVWGDPDSEYRQVVDRALAPYAKWWRGTPLRGAVLAPDGLLPGDYACTLAAGSCRIGIAGLNTTFLQLTGGDFRERLAWSVEQLQAACGGDAADWHADHDACLLLTHQGPDWLDRRGREEVYPEINPAGRFAAHLFGHMHATVLRTTTHGGGEPLRQWQGASLFGLETFGEPPGQERRHGYGAGRLTFGARGTTIRFWPRRAVGGPGGWRFVPDHESGSLEKDEGTRPEQVAAAPRRASRRAADKRRPAVAAGAGEGVLVVSYVKAARALWDIIDLAGLPEDERQLAMKRFMLRQLYVPLRMTVERATDEDAFAAIEAHRERRRLAAAGRTAAGEPVDGRRESLGGWLGSVLSGGPAGEDLPGKAAMPATVTPRLVILGDPGGGKTTLLRWLATAYLLRREGSPDLERLPDAASLPAADWLPVLIRCRELDREKVGQCTLEDLLGQTLTRMELPAAQAAALVPLLRGLLEAGRALLLVDGLDEITDPGLRAAFCERLEGLAKRFPSAPILVTSRIVGYREMHRRLGQGFAHATLAELSREEKDDFVGRWCEVTIADPARREAEAGKLRRGIHGSDRIERLTTNPMLLTTMALVQRKVGQLPNSRHKLYWEAVGVLLNWRAEVEEPMDPEEALPQLEYLAYAMCDQGVQRLRRDEVIGLLEDARRALPNIRPVQRQAPEAFLAELERRTGLLVEVGEVIHDGRPVPVYEFRHLTFQEYLAALALLKGRFPGHRQGTELAERVRPLAGRLAEVNTEFGEPEVTENWREALRLCVASCNDDDVEPVLRAILEPGRPEEARPRAILALLCLADEPHVSKETAEAVLQRFAKQVEARGGMRDTGAKRAAIEAAESEWAELLRTTLTAEFLRGSPESRSAPGQLAGEIGVIPRPQDETGWAAWTARQVDMLDSPSALAAVGAALAIDAAARERGIEFVSTPLMVERLVAFVGPHPAAADAASWALQALDRYGHPLELSPAQFQRLHLYLEDPDADPEALQALLRMIEVRPERGGVTPCMALLRSSSWKVRFAAASALGRLGDLVAVPELIETLHDQEPYVRASAASALGQLGNPAAVPELIETLRDQDSSVRARVASELGQLGDLAAVPELIETLRDQEPPVRASAASALSQLGDPAAVPELIETLRDQDSSVRASAASALGQLGDPAAVPGLIETLRDQDSSVRASAASALGQLGDPTAVPELIEALRDQQPNVRHNAAFALGQLGDPAALAGLRAALLDEDRGVRGAALSGLVRQSEDRVSLRLISRDLDAAGPWLDPQEMVSPARVLYAANRLSLPEEEVRSLYEALSEKYGLRLAWRPA